MQGKGFIKVVSVLLLLLSIYQLIFTWKASQIEKTAENEAKELVANFQGTEDEKYDAFKAYEQNYLDSIYEEPVFLNYFSYKKVKEAALKLGLDLQGGMSVVLEANLRNLLENLTDNSQNPAFLNALDAAQKAQQNSQESYIDLFINNFEGTDQELVALFQNADNDDQIGLGAGKDAVRSYLKKQAEDAFDSTYDIIQSRIDQFGLLQPSIQRQDATKRIMIEIPGVDNPARVRNLLQSTANLEFYEVYDNTEFSSYWAQANQAAKSELAESDTQIEEPKVETETAVEPTDSTATEEPKSELDALLEGTNQEAADSLSQSEEEFKKEFPIFAYLSPLQQPGPIVGYANKRDTADINKLLALPSVKAAFPANARLVWDAKAFESEDNDGNKIKLLGLYALRGEQDGSPQLDGGAIKGAYPSVDQYNNPVVSMEMNQQGAAVWYDLTGKNVGKPIAIVLDNKVYSAPAPSEAIAGGNSQISGNFTQLEAQDLATILKTGKLDVPAQIIEEEIVGPTIGGESAKAGVLSLVVGLGIVLVFMIFYYGKAGIIADIALLFNIILVIGILAAFGSTLTLPGIAGLVLTIGMAVDANVIIFERIREELANGFDLKTAVKKGYEASYSAIIDANVTTFIIAIILFTFGIGPIKGFATVLMIGILTSLFTGVLFTRVIKDDILQRGKHISYWTSMSKGWFQNLNFDFVSKRKIAYVISGALVLISLANLLVRGGKAFDLGVDLSSGRTYTVRFDEPQAATDIKLLLDEKFPQGTSNLVRTYGKEEQLKITTNLLTDQAGLEADEKAELMLYEALKEKVGNVDNDTFKSDYLLSRQKVDSTIADDLRNQSTWLTIVALVGIFIYLLIRFLKWEFGLAAVAALAHDTLILLAVFSFLRGVLPFALEVDQAFIAALLTVIGYSINDTVIVFDRIREELRLHPKKDYKEVINGAINSTLSRTIITSFTTLLVVLFLFIFGGEVIRGFAFALLVGVIVGTYSSVFVATPIVVDLFAKRKSKKLQNA